MNIETERRIVQKSEIHDLLAELETAIRDCETDFARVTIEPVTAEKHKANKKFAKAVEETDVCLSCGDPIEEGGFCSYSCLVNSGGDK